MAVEAAEEVVCGSVVGDFSEIRGNLILASASGCWSALFEAPGVIFAVIFSLPRWSEEVGCSLGKFGK